MKNLFLITSLFSTTAFGQCMDFNADTYVGTDDLIMFLQYFDSNTDCATTTEISNWGDYPNCINEDIVVEANTTATYNLILHDVIENDGFVSPRFITLNNNSCLNAYTIGGNSSNLMTPIGLIMLGSRIIVNGEAEVYIENNMFGFPEINDLGYDFFNIQMTTSPMDLVGWNILGDGNISVRSTPCE